MWYSGAKFVVLFLLNVGLNFAGAYEKTISSNKKYMYVDEANTWYSAANECARRRMHLLTIESADELSFIKDFLESIGKNKNFHWLGATSLGNKQNDFYWYSNGQPLDSKVMKWREGFPRNDSTECLELCKKSLHLKNKNCDGTLNFICEGSLKAKVDNPNLRGPIRMDKNGFSRYVVEEDKELNWFKARKECVLQGMSLVSIDSLEENLFLKTFINNRGLSGYSFWTSGHNFADNTTFKWANGREITGYTNFYLLKPTGGPQCLKTVEISLNWNDSPCRSQHRYICELNLSRREAKKQYPQLND